MLLCFIFLIVIVQFWAQVGAIKTSCFSIYSEEYEELESLIWAVGVPNITVVFTSNPYSNSFLDIYFYLIKNGKATRFATAHDFGFATSNNATLANIQSYSVVNRTMFNLTVAFPEPDLIDGHNISAHLLFGCNSETTSSIQLRHCSVPKDIIDASTTHLFRYNDRVLVQCNTVFIDDVNGSVIKRNSTREIITCGARAKWIGQRPQCWNGPFLDLTKGNLVQTFEQGAKVLMFCDVINQTLEKVAILGSEAVYYNGTKMAWAYVDFSNADNNRNVTCYQSSVTSQQSYQRSVKLNILYPPILDGLYQRSITLHKDVHVEIGFKSNPPVSGLNAVTVTKHGKSVENIYKKYEDNLNKVVLHFINASLSDLGEYNVRINSGHPFYTSQHFLVRVSARIPQAASTTLYSSTSAVPPPQANTSVPLSSLLIVTILLIISLLLLIIGAIKYFRVVRSKGKPKSDQPSVHFNKDLPGKAENVGNYEVPIAGNPYLPNPSQRPRPQGSNYQNMMSAGSSQQEESTYDCI